MNNTFETGGGERQFAALASSLDPTAFRLYLGCIRAVGAFLDGVGEVTPFAIGGSIYKIESWKMRWRLRRHLQNHNIAIAHAFDFYTNLTLIPAARMAQTPVVIGSHRQIGDLMTSPQFWAQATVFGWCDKVVCNSRAAAQNLLERGISARKIVVIGNGLPASAFAQAEPALPKIPNILRVGMIARMNAPYKNHPVFLSLAAKICAERPDVEFLLVGDGPLRAELERQVEDLRIANRVRFVGDQRDIPGVLASLDVSVMPSSSESFSNVILESMAAGIPVVAARVGGNPELLDDGRGIMFAAGDDSDLLACVRRILSDRGMRSRIGEHARQFARANFTMERITKEYENLYVDLLARSKRYPKIQARHQ